MSKLDALTAPDAERSLLGAVFDSDEALDAARVSPDAFYNISNRAIYRAMCKLRDNNTPIEIDSVAGQLVKDGTFQAVGGWPALTAFALSTATAKAVEVYADVVKDKHLLRRVVLLCERVSSLGTQGTHDGVQLLTELLRASHEVSGEGSPARSLFDVVKSEISRIKTDMEAGSNGEMIPTGLACIDEVTGGVPMGILTVIGARPSQGKSAFGLHLARAAAREGFGVHLMTWEDRDFGFAQRVIANDAKLVASDIRRRRVSKGQLATIESSSPAYESDKKVILEHAHGWSVGDLVRNYRGQKRRNQTKMLMLDYLQLISLPEGFKSPRHDGVRENMRLLQSLCGREGIAVVILCQLGRYTDRSGELMTPQMNHFRDSGSVEEYGKFLIGLSDGRPKNRSEWMPVNEHALNVHVLKNHNGPVADLKVDFDRATMTIRG